ncbi:uncharacterized protein LOC131429482 [Malaya genurostris]|uniref:uncharacterized protein LOC131429482 n=1 Tax=Malaya genurostris TaxID=325434 RepID=UPI0026F39D59|nr:uncharacterized protein LOC131429482 [Malaya genurostris]
MAEINTEDFIEEIRKRRAIWDLSGEEHRDRTMRSRQWEEVCISMVPNFSQLSIRQRMGIVIDLQKKWKHIRDALIKSLRCRRKRLKPYIYEKNLEFLNTSAKVFPDNSLIDLPNYEIVESVSEDGSDNNSIASDSEPNDTSHIADSKIEMITANGNYSDYYNGLKYSPATQPQKEHKTEDESGDMLFFRSLLPLVEPLSVRQKIKFRMEVMKKALEISEENAAQAEPYETFVVTHDPSTSGATEVVTQCPVPVSTNGGSSPPRKHLKREACDISDDFNGGVA